MVLSLRSPGLGFWLLGGSRGLRVQTWGLVVFRSGVPGSGVLGLGVIWVRSQGIGSGVLTSKGPLDLKTPHVWGQESAVLWPEI